MNDVVREAVARVLRYAPHLRDDLESEAVLAYLECPDQDHAAFVFRRLNRFIAANRSCLDGDASLSNAGHPLTLFDVGRKPVPLSPPKALTPFRRKTLRRNVVIQAAARQGCSQRLIADAFGLPRSLIATIVRKDLSLEFRGELRGKTDAHR